MKKSIPFDFAITAMERAISKREEGLKAVKRDIEIAMNPNEWQRRLFECCKRLGYLEEKIKKVNHPSANKKLQKERSEKENEIRYLKRLSCARLFKVEWDLSDEISDLRAELDQIKSMSAQVESYKGLSKTTAARAQV